MLRRAAILWVAALVITAQAGCSKRTLGESCDGYYDPCVDELECNCRDPEQFNCGDRRPLICRQPCAAKDLACPGECSCTAGFGCATPDGGPFCDGPPKL